MPDVVVTVPKSFGLERWAGEGDPPGSEWSGDLYGFSVAGSPKIEPGERVYVVCEGRLRGYAPLLYAVREASRTRLVRGGGAVAVTIDREISGFRGFRYAWWGRGEERPFEGWAESEKGGVEGG